MRTNLIMHFHCSDCGSVLNVLYDLEAKHQGKVEPYSTMYGHDKEPTGALVRYVPAILVEPCRKCIEKHTGPAKRLAQAISEIGARP